VRVAVTLEPGDERAQTGKLQQKRLVEGFDDVVREFRERPVGPRHAGRRMADGVFELDREDFVWGADVAAHLRQRLVSSTTELHVPPLEHSDGRRKLRRHLADGGVREERHA
jgi:hypothetical protein